MTTVHVTETITKTSAPTATSTCSPKKQAVTQSAPMTSRQPALEVFRPHIPHPSTIQAPDPGSMPEGYYIVTVGQEVGLFYHWDDVAAHINGVCGNIHKKYRNFVQTLQVYTRNYEQGKVYAVLVPNGPFWPSANLSSPSESLASTSSDEELWGQLEDLTDSFSQVTFK